MKTKHKLSTGTPRSCPDFTGRQVYFQMSKKNMALYNITDVTPRKLYTVISNSSSMGVTIELDNGMKCLALLNPYKCCFLGKKCGWKMKRLPDTMVSTRLSAKRLA